MKFKWILKQNKKKEDLNKNRLGKKGQNKAFELNPAGFSKFPCCTIEKTISNSDFVRSRP